MTIEHEKKIDREGGTDQPKQDAPATVDARAFAMQAFSPGGSPEAH